MKWKIYALVAVVAPLTIACGNSSDEEITMFADTVVNAPDTTTLTKVDSISTVITKVPAKTKESFEKKYPGATNVRWKNQEPGKEDIDWELSGWQEMDEQDHKVWFHWQGNDHQSRYDKNSNWVGTTNEIRDPGSLPAAVTQAIKKQFGGYTVKAVTREDDNNRIAYEIKLEKGNEKVKSLIAENGTVLKTKRSSK